MLRSYLFVPGNRPERYEKALASRAGAVIVDLEDAVAPDEKQAARSALLAWLEPAKAVVVRVNAPATEWFESDLEVCSRPGVTAVVVPKAETAEQVARYLRVDKFTVYRLVTKKKIPAFKVGNQWRFKRELLDEWLKKNSNLD